MLTKLRLERFKNFKQAELALGLLTLLVGTNASGKSNIRDAFRFLHGIARGYTLAEIIGEKYGEGGERQWTGIRGGPRELTFQGAPTFKLEVSFTVSDESKEHEALYSIEVDPGSGGKTAYIVQESLLIENHVGFVTTLPTTQSAPFQLDVQVGLTVLSFSPNHGKFVIANPRNYILLNQQPVLSQWVGRTDAEAGILSSISLIFGTLSSMRFLDLSPDAMRTPAFPGQYALGDHGENLSSVLLAICEDKQRKQTLIQWIQELTPMDVYDFEFPDDPLGRVLVTLVEANGQRTTAYSASDGTLRFLGMLAALLGPTPARFYFFEELENGIHPTRLHLLLQLIEQQVSRGAVQVVATTHSPQLLRLVSSETLKHAALTYRLEGHTDAQIKRILDIPDAQRIIQQHDLARLYESGWLENSLAFVEDEEAVT